MQILETLAECLRGPNVALQKEVLNSYFFFDVNRIFSSCYYLGVAQGMLWASPEPMSTCTHAQTGGGHNDTATLSSGSTRASDSGSTREGSSGVTVNDLLATLKLSTLKCCLAMFDTVIDRQAPIEMLGFLNVRNIISQIIATSQLLGLEGEQHGLMQGMRKGAGSITAGIRVASRTEWRPRLEDFGIRRRLGYQQGRSSNRSFDVRSNNLAPGDDAPVSSLKESGLLKNSRYWATYGLLRREVTRMYELIQYLARYDDSGNVSVLLNQFSSEHKGISDYLKTHVGSVDIVRTVRASEWTLKPAGASSVEEEATETHVHEKQYTVSEHIAKLIESNHFRKLWLEMIYSLPLDNPEEKFAVIMDAIQDVTAMATWMHYLNENSPVMRCIIKHRETLRSMPLYLALAITMLLTVFYGIPMDPNTGNVVGDGRFHPVFHFSRAQTDQITLSLARTSSLFPIVCVSCLQC